MTDETDRIEDHKQHRLTLMVEKVPEGQYVATISRDGNPPVGGAAEGLKPHGRKRVAA